MPKFQLKTWMIPLSIAVVAAVGLGIGTSRGTTNASASPQVSPRLASISSEPARHKKPVTTKTNVTTSGKITPQLLGKAAIDEAEARANEGDWLVVRRAKGKDEILRAALKAHYFADAAKPHWGYKHEIVSDLVDEPMFRNVPGVDAGSFSRAAVDFRCTNPVAVKQDAALCSGSLDGVPFALVLKDGGPNPVFGRQGSEAPRLINYFIVKEGQAIKIATGNGLSFAGDLNKDGMVDFVVWRISHDSEARTYELILSSPGAKDEWQAIANHLSPSG